MILRSVIFIGLAAMVALAHLLGPNNLRAASDEPSDEITAKLFSTWSAREEQVASARIRWREQRVYAKGSLLAQTTSGTSPGGAFPAQDARFTVDSGIQLKGAWLRHEGMAPRIVSPGRAIAQDYVSSFDGNASKMLMQSKDLDPRGTVFREKRNTDAMTVALRPLMLCIRPSSPSFGAIKRTDLTVSGEDALIDGIRCLVAQDQHNLYWVDPARDFVIIAWKALSGAGKVMFHAKINYALGDCGLWLPQQWTLDTYALNDTDAVSESIAAEVVSIEINVPLTQDDFALEFPARARVYDQLSREEYIIRPDGSKKILPEGTGALSYDDLLKDELQTTPATKSRWPWIIGINAALGLFLCVAAYLSFRRSNGKDRG
jgi:hypothetical protein